MSNNYSEILKGMLPEGVKPEDNLYSTLLKEVAEHGGGGEPIDTYTKEQIDNKLAKKTQDVHLYSDGTYIGYFSEKDDDEPTVLTYEDVKALIENETNNVYLTNGYYSFHTKYIYRTFISGQEVGAIGFIGETQLNDNVYSYRVIINENNEVKDDEIMLAKASDMADKYGIETDTVPTIESKVAENSETLGYVKGKNLFDKNAYAYNSQVAYQPLYIGNVDKVTMSTTMPLTSNNLANILIVPGEVTSGGTSADDGVTAGVSRTVDVIDGYVTIITRSVDGVDPRYFDTMLNTGETILPYESYANPYTVDERLNEVETTFFPHYTKFSNWTIETLKTLTDKGIYALYFADPTVSIEGW